MPLDHDEPEVRRRVLKSLRVGEEELEGLSIERKSFDARDRRDIRVVYAIVASLRSEPRNPFPASVAIRVEARRSYEFPAPRAAAGALRPVVVGSGPAGLFCALILAENGFRPIVLERGDEVGARDAKVRAFFESGKLDPESNIQFGEGGAGTYSDGKLNTTVTDPSFRGAKVLEEFVRAGAPPEIRYLAKPHIGTDYLVRVVPAIRKKIESLGGEVRFRSKVTSIALSGGRARGVLVNGSESLESDIIVLAPGHSARDSFLELERAGLAMERKAFAIGLRIEHPQEMISRRQFGESWRHPGLPVADYKLTHRSSDGRGVYSFCMCPGGYVVNSSSEPDMVACNGMSDYRRNSANANSAIVVSVTPDDFGGEGPLAGVEFQRKWERLAFEAGGGSMSLPIQLFGDFLAGKASSTLGGVSPSARGGRELSDLNRCLPDYVAAAIKEGVRAFDRSIPGFARPDALLSGVETRTSSPLRMLRGEDFQSSIPGIYPCGEGAGHSGGIMSSAIDGIKVAEALALAQR
jgi:uncharacterized protein